MSKKEKIILLISLLIITFYNCFEIFEEFFDHTRLEDPEPIDLELLIVFI